MHGGLPSFAGLRITQDRKAAAAIPGLMHSPCRRVNDLVLRGECIGSGSNSGFQALNLVLRTGCRDIVLVGYDCTLRHGVHWHGRHQPGLNNPTQAGVDAWAQHLERAGPVLEKLGVRVLNASLISAVTAFPRMSFEEAMCHERQLPEQRQLHPQSGHD